MDRPAVLVTGASKGIGEACVLRLCARGFFVFAGVRRVEDGEALRGQMDSDRLIPVLLDVTEEEQIRSAAAVVEERCGERGLAGLVNNAGIAVAGPMEFLPIAEFRRQLEVNVLGQVAVTQALMPALRRARGRIVFISSIAGRSAMPFTGAYGASKHAIEAIADSLRVELMDAGIEVSVVEPGTIATPIWETAIRHADRIMKDMPPQLSEYYGRPLEGLRRIANRGVKGASPELVADVVEHALTASRPKPRYVVGKDAKLRLALERFLPTRVRDRVIANRLKRV
ncbi:MAG: SDR family NAD(P)-dependent oxidoreductase [Longimicrobiales bacterium]